MELKIIEWNVNEQNTVGKMNEDRRKDIVDKIDKLEADADVDIVVLTEVKLSYRDFMEALSKHYFALGSSNGGNGNNIIIAVSPKKIERVFFEDYYIYPTRYEDTKKEKERSCHPDRLLANVKLKDSDIWFKILGIRMQVSGLSFYDFEDQKEALKFEIEDAKPDVIIGDFNWISAFKPYGEDLPKEFEEYIKEKQYEMFPSSSDKDSFSFWTKSNSDKHTSPDRVLYKKELVTEAPDIKPDKNHHYYHQELFDYKSYKDFSEGWPSDHDILVVTVTIPDKNE